MLNYILIGAYVCSTAFGLVLLKLGTTTGLPISFVENSIKFNFNLLSFSGFFLYGVSFLLYIYLLSKFNLGFVIPLTTALVYVLIFIASFVIFKESFSAIKIFAITLILSGVVILNLNK